VKIKILPGLLFCLMMGACVTEGGTLSAGGAQATSTPVLVAVRQGNDGEAVPTESVLAMPTGPAALLPVTSTPSPESNLRSIDLSAFADAWSSGDVKTIKTFYAPGAAYVSAEDAVALQRKEPVSVFVADAAFSERVRAHQGLKFRIMGEPIRIFDKLVGLMYRLEDDTEGYNGVALLRYEGEKIWLHTYVLSAERTPNPAKDAEMLAPIDLTALMDAWSSGDVSAVRGFYNESDGVFAVFNDEDIALSLRGTVHTQDELAGSYLASEIRTNSAPWGMRAVGQPQRLGDLVLYAWSWKIFDFPVGYGVRFMRYDGDKIATDIRYAIRPWEVGGGQFMAP
jgi:hypothetical protein